MYNDTQQINHEGNKMKLSILNLAPVREGQTYLQAVESMVILQNMLKTLALNAIGLLSIII